MDEISLSTPDAIRQSLPDDGDTAARDMEQEVATWERRLNRTLDDADDEDATRAVVDILERFEDRWEQYDELVAELRAWGESPIYAMAWRDLHAALIRQVYEHGDLGDRIDRERQARVVGGRFGD